MPKRFSRYDFALKAVDGQAPASSPAGKYKEYKTGEKKVTYTRGPNSLPGTLVQVFLVPFGVDGSDLYAVQYSGRAQSKFGVTGLGNEILGLAETGGSAPRSNPGFVPARAVVRAASDTKTPKLSDITGVSYRRDPGAASYTYPFGTKSPTGPDSKVQTRAAAIREAVEAKAASNSVSFKPEQFKLV
jgi:hypothetical protein